MIQRIKRAMVKWFHYVMLDCVDLFMPGWLDSMMDHWFDGAMVECLPDHLLPADLEFYNYAESNITTYSVLKNNKLFFDFNPN